MRYRNTLTLLSLAAMMGVLAVVFAGSGAGPTELLGLFPLPAHLFAFTAAASTLAGRSVRSQILARAIGERLDFSTALRAQLAADAGGFVTPARVGSEAGKLLILYRGGVGAAPGAAINLAEILWEAVAVALLVLLLVATLPFAEALPALGAISYVVGVGAVLGGSLFVAALPGEIPPRSLTRFGIHERRWRAVRSFASGFIDRTRILLRIDRRRLLILFSLTVATIAARLAVLPLLLGAATSRAGAELIVWPLLLLYGGALIPLPGGGGAVELGFLAALGGELSPPRLAASLLWWRFYTHYLSAAAGGVVLLHTLRGSLAARRA